MCACSAAQRSIHVAAANGMTTSLLPNTICLLCANLSQHIEVWQRPHLTPNDSMTGRRKCGETDKGEKKTRAEAKTRTLWVTSERGQCEFIRGQTQRNIHMGHLGDSSVKQIHKRIWVYIWIRSSTA